MPKPSLLWLLPPIFLAGCMTPRTRAPEQKLEAAISASFGPACSAGAETVIRDIEQRIQLCFEDLRKANWSGYKCILGGSRNAGRRDLSPGTLEGTRRNLDVAIEGKGFFSFRRPDGSEVYSRCSRFHITAEGRLASESGYLLQPSVTFPEDTISIVVTEYGEIRIAQACAQDIFCPVGQFILQRFVNPQGLRSQDGVYFEASELAGSRISDRPGRQGMGTLHQGFVERSNVEIVQVELRLARLRRQLAGLLAQIAPELVAPTERLHDAEQRAATATATSRDLQANPSPAQERASTRPIPSSASSR